MFRSLVAIASVLTSLFYLTRSVYAFVLAGSLLALSFEVLGL